MALVNTSLMCPLNKELVPYEEVKRLDVPWIEIGLLVLIVFYIEMTQENPAPEPLFEYQEEIRLREELEMARQHAAVLERDLEQYKQLVAELTKKKNTEELDELILSALFENKEGLTAKMLLIMLKPLQAEIKKTDINKRLYTMLNKNTLRKSNDKAPVWSLNV